MIIRKIRPEEVKRTSELFSIAFEFGMDNDKSAQEVFDEVSNRPGSREDAYWNERWAAFQDDDRTMMSYFVAKPLPVQFDGNIYRMTGIGGVSSLPQYRRTGAVRRCFETALPSMYEEGYAFSYLYPFSSVFYRKFGYEMGCEGTRYHIRLNSLPRFDVDGSCSLVEPGNILLPQIRQIYQTWQSKYNMMVANESYEYDWVNKSDPVRNQEFTYVYQSKEQIPMGYLTVKQVTETDGRNLYCTRFVFTCPEGLKGLLNLLLAFAADHDYVTLELPADVDMSLVLPEWSRRAVAFQKYHSGMVRVINAEMVLKGARYQGSGRIAIKITDRQVEQNQDVFVVSFSEGRAVSVKRDETEKPDISLGINEFSRLIIGAGDITSLPYMENVAVYHEDSAIAQVFYRKPNLILESF